MNLFRRVMRWLFLLVGVLAGLATAVAAFFAQRLIRPPRQRLWATPGDLGLAYEDVQFPARDGIRLSGWFIPAPADSLRQGATILLTHGWPWNRLGLTADDTVSGLDGSKPVDLLRLALALHRDGYHLLMFDLRNHGESAASEPVTFGWLEANDLLGALAYLNGRAEVDAERIGAAGFSMGANTILYTLPQTNMIEAAVVVQPTSAAVYARRYGTDILGPLGHVVTPLAELMYRAAGGLRFGALQPAFPASGAGPTPVLYIQGKGDRWGSPQDVADMVARTPQAHGPLFTDGVHRFDGYQYVIDHPETVMTFFEEHLGNGR
ncbi:MAG: alpha/beta hydrolase [Chloroflexi bacterium]|nr:alpha/beta hydrolase [Chloroflexota bacterium]